MSNTLDKFRYAVCTACKGESSSERLLARQYKGRFDFVFKRSIEDIMGNEREPHVLLYKEKVLFDDDAEYLKRFYARAEVPNKLALFTDVYASSFPAPRPQLYTIDQAKMIFRRNDHQRKIFVERTARRKETAISTEKRGNTSNYVENKWRKDSAGRKEKRGEFERILDDKFWEEENGDAARASQRTALGKRAQFGLVASPMGNGKPNQQPELPITDKEVAREVSQGARTPYLTARGRFAGDKQLRLTIGLSVEKKGSQTTRSTKNTSIPKNESLTFKNSLTLIPEPKVKFPKKRLSQKAQTPMATLGGKGLTFRQIGQPRLVTDDFDRGPPRKTETPKGLSSYLMRDTKQLTRAPLAFGEITKSKDNFKAAAQRQSLKDLRTARVPSKLSIEKSVYFSALFAKEERKKAGLGRVSKREGSQRRGEKIVLRTDYCPDEPPSRIALGFQTARGPTKCSSVKNLHFANYSLVKSASQRSGLNASVERLKQSGVQAQTNPQERKFDSCDMLFKMMMNRRE